MLEYYKYLLNYDIDLVKHKPIAKPVKKHVELPKLEVRNITLSQFDDVTSNYITAHNIDEYRRKSFKVQLVPHVDLILDNILKEVYEFECL